MEYLDFDLLIERSGEQYLSHVLYSPAGQASANFAMPFSEMAIENFCLKIGRPRRGMRRLDSPEMDAAKTFGKRLFETIFSDEIGSCFRSSLDQAEGQHKGLRVRLRINSPELTDLPWEYLYTSALNHFLVLSVKTPVVRYIELPQRIEPLTVTPPLSILVMISSPSDYPTLDTEQEWNKLVESLEPLKQRKLVKLERTADATLLTLQRTLRRGNFHIFHFIGHGAFDPQAQDGVLLFEDEQKRGRRVSGQNLGMLLHNHLPLRVALLNACEGARTSRTDPFSGTAQSLVQKGIPAVIAMQFEITDIAAITFSQEFYAALADGYSVDAALVEARTAIFAQGNDVEWGTPVLYMRTPDGRIFNIEPAPQMEKSPHQKSVVTESNLKAEAIASIAPETESEKILSEVKTASPSQTTDETLAAQEAQFPKTPTIRLRSQPIYNFSDNACRKMLKEKNFFDSSWNEKGEGLLHQYQAIEREGQTLVIDYATGLMWQQSGSPDYVLHAYAKKYIRKLNLEKFAGFSDWRLPTFEEVTSLMEPEKKNGNLHIDQVFDKQQFLLWTADTKASGSVWYVDFSLGHYPNPTDHCYVRAVRDGQATPISEPKAEREEDISSQTQPPQASTVRLRSQPIHDFSDNAFRKLVKEKNFFDPSYNEQGEGLLHQYQTIEREGEKLVIDHTTSLTWQQSGSSTKLTSEKGEKYIYKLNREKFAGFSDWRLPTMEEVHSLFESEKKNGDLYIDPVFDKQYTWIWTADKEASGARWYVDFSRGLYTAPDDRFYIRAVRDDGQTTAEPQLRIEQEEAAAPQKRPPKTPIVLHLRSQPILDLSERAVRKMLKERDFFDLSYNKNGKGLLHQYKAIKRQGEKIVIDHATGLIWQRSGSSDKLRYTAKMLFRKSAENYLHKLNEQNFAGFNDWRLPTLEEAMSLMELERKNGDLYINPVFDRQQRWIWTADKELAVRVWVVYLCSGFCTCANESVDKTHNVRAVRSGH